MSFWLNIGGGLDVTPSISIDSYFDKFVDVMLGIGLVFELPVLIFFLTLLRVVSPSFLLDHSRYAILAIVIVAAFVTPKTDAFTLMLFVVPMSFLFFLGVFDSYMLVLRRENQSFPWRALVRWFVIARCSRGPIRRHRDCRVQPPFDLALAVPGQINPITDGLPERLPACR